MRCAVSESHDKNHKSLSETKVGTLTPGRSLPNSPSQLLAYICCEYIIYSLGVTTDGPDPNKQKTNQTTTKNQKSGQKRDKKLIKQYEIRNQDKNII